ncbi:Conserved hypothetical protein [Herminiimonas arsenicoxydans]|uniref:ATPase n=1 Tax=Herminiimonas arsenicoxydans TaxID=204773 RepID=A4G663_HERAR|nr:Conserved hypothetical protein [Herminiimonas arsenicoxydans]
MKSRNAPPRADAMIEALRGLGYSLPSALADIIDNSIAAEASEIDVTFVWNGAKSFIRVHDNGTGMDEAEIDLAMRLGEKNPLHSRNASDLGRFGLGLKTASFSQCRRLTVATVKNFQINCLRWDLDVLAGSSDGAWHLLEGPADGSEDLLQILSPDRSGTIVIWEVLDRIVTAGFVEQDLLDLIDTVERHLAMVFHRYIEGARARIQIKINGRTVRAWDPFFISHSATWTSPIERLPTASGLIEIQSHILPHRDRLTQAEHLYGEGPDGWTAQQGFYVYRNERLLLSGSWLGLGRGRSWTKEESHRLARIRLDIPNSADIDWKIDVRKSTARPPVQIRERLMLIAEDARERARRVFAHRGNYKKTADGTPIEHAWLSEKSRAGISYRINAKHPAIKGLLDDAGPLKSRIQVLLRILEETVPVQKIWLDTVEAKDTPRTNFSGQPNEHVNEVLLAMYEDMTTRRGMSCALAKLTLGTTEPFHNFPFLISALPEEHINVDK